MRLPWLIMGYHSGVVVGVIVLYRLRPQSVNRLQTQTPAGKPSHRFRNAAAILVVFIIGILLGAAGSSGTKVGTSTATTTSTQTSTLVSTTTWAGTSTVTTVSTQASTLVSTTTATVTRLRAGAVLVNYSGSGTANSPPFTATTSMANVTLEVSSSNPSLSTVGWFVYPTSSPIAVSLGEVSGKVGTFDFYAYNLTPGATYYVSVLSANANWQITVNAVA